EVAEEEPRPVRAQHLAAVERLRPARQVAARAGDRAGPAGGRHHGTEWSDAAAVGEIDRTRVRARDAVAVGERRPWLLSRLVPGVSEGERRQQALADELIQGFASHLLGDEPQQQVVRVRVVEGATRWCERLANVTERIGRSPRLRRSGLERGVDL